MDDAVRKVYDHLRMIQYSARSNDLIELCRSAAQTIGNQDMAARMTRCIPEETRHNGSCD